MVDGRHHRTLGNARPPSTLQSKDLHPLSAHLPKAPDAVEAVFIRSAAVLLARGPVAPMTVVVGWRTVFGMLRVIVFADVAKLNGHVMIPLGNGAVSGSEHLRLFVEQNSVVRIVYRPILPQPLVHEVSSALDHHDREHPRATLGARMLLSIVLFLIAHPNLLFPSLRRRKQHRLNY
jgi:hypothetical protein